MKPRAQHFRGYLRLASSLFATAAVVNLAEGPATATARAQGTPLHTVRLTVGASGFQPKRISVPLGLVHFIVTSREGDHCFAVPALDVEKRVRASRPLEVDVTFDRSGEFPFACCVESAGSAETGIIVVGPQS